jgi:outer membrane protein
LADALLTRARCAALSMAALFLVAVVGSASDAATLGVEDCVKLALSRHGRLAAGDAEVRAATAHAKVAAGARRPVVQAHGGASFAPIDGFDPALTEGGELSALVSVEQPVYDGGRARLEQSAASAGVQTARAARAVSAADIAFDTRLACIDLWSAARRVEVLAHGVEDLQSEQETIDRLARGGTALRTDALRLATQLETEGAALDAAKGETRAAELRLLGLIGAPTDSLVALEDTLRIAPPESRWSAAAAPDVQQTQAEVQAAKIEHATRRAERRPRVTLAGEAGAWTGRNQLLEPGRNHVLGYRVGVEVAMPLWDNGAGMARVEEDAAHVEARLADRRAVEQQLTAEDAAERSAFETARAHAERLARSLSGARRIAVLVRERWAGGAASGFEVLEAHRAYVEIALTRIDAEADAARARARLLRLGGTP